jgi:hypothetical protein
MKSFLREKISAIFPSLDPNNQAKQLIGKSPAEVFAGIYTKKIWGGRLAKGFNSGTGSRNVAVVAPYVQAVSTYLKHYSGTIVDVGCGDFKVTSQLVGRLSNNWICCDIFPALIEANNKQQTWRSKLLMLLKRTYLKATLLLSARFFNISVINTFPKLYQKSPLSKPRL